LWIIGRCRRKSMKEIRIGVSKCLLGEQVRYDGGHQHDRYLTGTLGQYFFYVPVCPEVEYGLPIPREALHLTGDPANPRLVTVKTGVDHTDGMLKWAEKRLDALEKERLAGFIFKSRSPSSGMQSIKVYSPSGMPSHRGVGVFAAAFMRRFPLVPVEDDGRLHDPALRENFIERVFALKRWYDLQAKGPTLRDLIDFHTEHKLLVLAHSPKHYTALGRLVADAKHYQGDVFVAYLALLMNGLRLLATVKKNTNVLTHLAGYFKKSLSTEEKKEVADIIDQYHRGLLPLVVPITLIRHYVRKYDEPYLKRQQYLNPHPTELMLRNHV
jgi:uncharacterized protein YbgA (DUF1722 family)/uncharacterized protein YbbK (DUF523 family)